MAIALIASWVVAIVFAPLLGVVILPKVQPVRGSAEEGASRFRPLFRAVVLACMRRRYLVIGATLALFAVSVAALRFVPQHFFPAADRPELLVDLTMPLNSSIRHTETEVEQFESLLRDDPDIDHFSTYVGAGAVRFYLPLNVRLPDDSFAQAVIVTKGLAQRERVRERLERTLAERLPNVLARVYPLELGPPVGWPLQYRVSGPDVQRVRDLAYKVAAIVAANPFAHTVSFDWTEPIKVVRLQLDQDKARPLGITSAALADAVNATVSGMTITQVRDNVYLVDVVARARDEERVSLDTLRSLQLPIAGGRTVPLVEVASLDYALEQPMIRRRDRRPTITVQGDVAKGIEAETVTRQLAPAIAALDAKLPVGYRIDSGGIAEAAANGLGSVATLVPAMVVIMLTILMVQLQSFRRLLLVISVGPLGLIGVVAVLLPTHTPIGFIAFLGIIALTGMIIRNSVILIDQIATEMAAGKDAWNAVLDATLGRTRPILLTAAAAIIGMLPIARDVFWGPMAYAVIGGLAGATLLTLLFLPALYVAWFGVHEPAGESAIGDLANPLQAQAIR